MLPTKPPPTFKPMSPAEWTGYPKDGFDRLIRRWCERHGFYEYVDVGRKIPNRMPYHRGDPDEGEQAGMVYAAEDFLALADAYRAKEIFWYK